MTIRRGGVAAVLVTMILATACGGRFSVSARGAEYPIGLTQGVYSPTGKVLLVPDDLRVVHHFKRTLYHWTILWGAIDLQAREHDISAMLGAIVRAYDGEAVVNLTTTVEGWNFLWNCLGVVPIIPTVVAFYVEGDVVVWTEPRGAVGAETSTTRP